MPPGAGDGAGAGGGAGGAAVHGVPVAAGRHLVPALHPRHSPGLHTGYIYNLDI